MYCRKYKPALQRFKSKEELKEALYNDNQEDEVLQTIKQTNSMESAILFYENIGLPHHPLFKTEMVVELFENILTSYSVPPTAIMIARSENDEYTPKANVNEVESLVLEMLNKYYANIVIVNGEKEELLL